MSIQVTSPKKGDKLYIGDTYAIRWELSGNLVATARSTRVKILLMNYIVSFRFLNKTLEEILNSNYKFIASGNNWEL